MKKHLVYITVAVELETEESLTDDELEEILYELDYDFYSEYASTRTEVRENEVRYKNK